MFVSEDNSPDSSRLPPFASSLNTAARRTPSSPSTTYVRDPHSGPPPHSCASVTPANIQHGSFDRNFTKTRKIFKSTLLSVDDEPIDKPWLAKKDPLKTLSHVLSYCGMLICTALTVAFCFFGAKSVKSVGDVCLVMDEDFSSGLNTSRWAREVNLGGFNNGEFEMATSSPNNSYVENGVLYIVPTLTSDVIGTDSIFNGYTYNLTGCTTANATACGTVSNLTLKNVINPVQSARLTTINSTSIKYGRVEVTARLPKGDWLWPRIWMMPVNDTYGLWPMSGEIDIMQARGNNDSYAKQGRNYVRSALQWGPETFVNSVAKTYGWWTDRRATYAQQFHTYTLEWTEAFFRCYVDNRNTATLNLKLNKPFYERGDYGMTALNGTTEVVLSNPWFDAGNNAAPFDQEFYLIIDLAVGGTQGWFPDGYSGKPWLDSSLDAMYEFAKAQDKWYATWPTDPKERGMAISSVKMYQKC